MMSAVAYSTFFYGRPQKLAGHSVRQVRVLLPRPVSRHFYPVVRASVREQRPVSIEAGPLRVTLRGAEGPEAEANLVWAIRKALEISRRVDNERR